jgi:pimeloyl-ACP methyl ester carboxylesterase
MITTRFDCVMCVFHPVSCVATILNQNGQNALHCEKTSDEAPMHIQGFAEVNGATLHYEVYGEGSPLILLHAGIADARMWHKQTAAFAKHHTVITYDLRGFGQSNNPDGDFAHYKDLHMLMQVLEVNRAALCGVSMGGTVALDFALEYPQQVTALVTVCSTPGGWFYEGDEDYKKRWQQMRDEFDKLVESGKLAEASELEVRWWIDGPRAIWDVDPAVRSLVWEMNLNAIQQNNDNAVHRRPPSAVGRLDQINVPALLVAGQLDVPSVHAALEVMAAGIHGAKQTIIPTSTHLPNMERPDEFNRLVLDFLREHGV